MSNFDLNIPRMGYFILYRHSISGSFVGDQIKKAQLKAGFEQSKAKFTHVEVSLGGQHSVYVAPPMAKTIDITEKNKGKYIMITKYKGYEGNNKRYKIAAWSASLCNLRYDWFGVLRFKFRWLFRNMTQNYFCSENAAFALNKEFPQDRKPEDWYPAHFLGDEFETVWAGYIN